MPRILNKYTDIIPVGAVNIMRPTKWGNKWSHVAYSRGSIKVKTQQEAVTAHRLWFLTSDEAAHLRDAAKAELKGRDFICCHPGPCHGDVYLEYANAD